MLVAVELRSGRRLRRTHIRRRTPGEKIFPRRREDVYNLGVFGEKTFVLGVAGNNCNIARGHRTPLLADAEIHRALEHSNDLLVRMPMRTGVRARLDFPPHDHSMLPRKNASLNFVGDALPRQFLKRAEPRHHGHDGFLSVALPPIVDRRSRLAVGGPPATAAATVGSRILPCPWWR